MKHLSLESQTRMRENEAAYAEVRALLARDPEAVKRQTARFWQRAWALMARDGLSPTGRPLSRVPLSPDAVETYLEAWRRLHPRVPAAWARATKI